MPIRYHMRKTKLGSRLQVQCRGHHLLEGNRPETDEHPGENPPRKAQGVKLSKRRLVRKGPHKGELEWAALMHSRALYILHNPCYVGAFVYQRNRTVDEMASILGITSHCVKI